MADNVVLNSGTGGSTLSTDEVTRATVVQHVQYVKLMNGTDAAIDVIPGDATNGLDVDVTRLPALAAGTNNIGDVDVLTVPAPLSTTGGGTEATALRVTVASDSTGVLSVDDNGGSLTVDGTVTANLAAGTNNIGDVDVLTVPAPLNVTGTGVELGALRVTIASDSTGVLSVDDNGGSLTVDGSVSITGAVDTELTTADLDTGAGTDTRAVIGLVGSASGGAQIIPGSATDGLLVNLGANNDVTVTGTVTANLAAGTNNIGDVDILTIAAGDNNIGNVDIVTMPNVTLAAGTNTNEVVGDVAHDAVAAGNPVLVAASSETMADSAPANRVSADADATRFSATDGALYVIPCGPQTWSYHVNGSAALTDASVHAAPGAGLSLYVTDIVISSGAATAMNAFFEEATTTVLGPYYLEAVAGRGCALHFGTPKKITANTALTVTTSAAIAHAIDVTGFIAPG